MRRIQGRAADMELVGVLRAGRRAAQGVPRALRHRRGPDVRVAGRSPAAREAGGGRGLLVDARPSSDHRGRRRARRPRDGREAAGGVGQGRPRHRGGRGEGPHPRDHQLRDHLVSQPSRHLAAPEGAEGRRRAAQDGGDGRARRPEGDQRPARVPRLAARPGAERRRRPVRLRLLRRQPDDVADGRPASRSP